MNASNNDYWVTDDALLQSTHFRRIIRVYRSRSPLTRILYIFVIPVSTDLSTPCTLIIVPPPNKASPPPTYAPRRTAFHPVFSTFWPSRPSPPGPQGPRGKALGPLGITEKV